MEYRAELRVIPVARDAVMFLSIVLSLGHLVYGLDIIRDDELPITKALAENFLGFPSEKFLCRRRPAQNSELMVPFDDCEWSILNVKSEARVIVKRRGFNSLALSYVANDRDSTDHFAFFIVTRRVVTIKETTATGLRDDVGAVFSDYTSTR